ncbi:uncharacterized protein LOC141915201 isoform X2 [Tubulanus polymorphus]|uniref:uncharacterized protein LOC141915201 isoform X2 n=1 Tax=Tubulanus polymorphus TaxID=672921 RepID=UPI003DA21332
MRELPFKRYKLSSPTVDSTTTSFGASQASSISLPTSQQDPLVEYWHEPFHSMPSLDDTLRNPLKAGSWDPDQWQTLFHNSLIGMEPDDKGNQSQESCLLSPVDKLCTLSKRIKVEPEWSQDVTTNNCTGLSYEPMEFDVVHNTSKSCCVDGRHDGIQDLLHSSRAVDGVAVEDSNLRRGCSMKRKLKFPPDSPQYQYYDVGRYIHQQPDKWKTTTRTRGIEPDSSDRNDEHSQEAVVEMNGLRDDAKQNKVDLRKTSWMNGFMMFSRLHRRDYIMANKGMPTAQVSKLLGQTWRKMSPQEQEPYRLRRTPKR